MNSTPARCSGQSIDTYEGFSALWGILEASKRVLIESTYAPLYTIVRFVYSIARAPFFPSVQTQPERGGEAPFEGDGTLSLQDRHQLRPILSQFADDQKKGTERKGKKKKIGRDPGSSPRKRPSWNPAHLTFPLGRRIVFVLSLIHI